MSLTSPSVVVIAGPNGAGKSTIAPDLLRGALGVQEFVNADVIAHGLSAFNVESVAIAAGRAMLRRIGELTQQRVSFAFETTLASRALVPQLASYDNSRSAPVLIASGRGSQNIWVANESRWAAARKYLGEGR